MLSGDLLHTVARAVMVLVPMVLSLTVHEYAHAFAAKRLGDDTAQRMGRLTLNPAAHIDPVGTIGLPLLLLIFGGGFFFGWAKPVPFNPSRFTRRLSVRTGIMLTAVAGPVSNLLIAFLGAGMFSLAFNLRMLEAVPASMQELVATLIGTNIGLFLFNMIPVGPLDGQKVLSGLLPTESAIRFERFNLQFGSWLLLGVVFFARDIMVYPYAMVRHGILAVVGLV